MHVRLDITYTYISQKYKQRCVIFQQHGTFGMFGNSDQMAFVGHKYCFCMLQLKLANST